MKQVISSWEMKSFSSILGWWDRTQDSYQSTIYLSKMLLGYLLWGGGFFREQSHSVENIQYYVLTSLSLYHYLRQTENSLYYPYVFVDIASNSGEKKEGEWRRSPIHENIYNLSIKLEAVKEKLTLRWLAKNWRSISTTTMYYHGS